ncbi:MAG TPA: biopolymer transporter ExbD [Candidatus Brocadiia bacterium]|nr:biopolymer transporter ExbD [Candidatus Brocadiia bacterium]
MAMTLRKPGSGTGETPELNLTPMIDVVFQLLSFFLVTARFLPSEGILQTQMPEPTKATAAKPVENPEDIEVQEFEDVVVHLRMDGDTDSAILRIKINSTAVDSIASLYPRLARIRNLFKDSSKGPPRCVINCADDVRYKDLVKAISAAQQAEFPNISFANVRVGSE